MHTRSHVLKAHVLWLLIGVGCATDKVDSQGSAEPASAAASATTTGSTGTASADVSAMAPIPISPTFGGSVVSVGQYQTELAVFADGGIDGLVFDGQGTAVAPELVTQFSAAFSVDGNAKADVKLLWDAAAKRFRGQHGLDAKLVGRRIDVTLDIAGKTQSGVLAVYVPLIRAKGEGSAQLQADAKLPSASAKAELESRARALGDAKASLSGGAKAAAKAPAKAGASAKASTKVEVPKPKVEVSSDSAAAKEKSGAAASVKAKAKFGFGN